MDRAHTLSCLVDPGLAEALAAYLGECTGRAVEVHETHISWVLLAGDRAYKLKKPVRLPFLDFSTLAARKYFCEEELRLNRAMGSPLYLGVMPVLGSAGAPRLNGEGEAIDYLVCMRRFAPGALLAERLHAGLLEPGQVERFGRRLAELHRRAEVVPDSADENVLRQVAAPVLDLVDAMLRGCHDERLHGLRRWFEDGLRALAPVFLARRRQGSVRECHGDLHLGNVVEYAGELAPFDCIEFDPALRAIDVMSDLAFLTMDLRAQGRADLAFRLLDAYLQQGGDYGGVQVLRFYEVYRALVRAWVAVLRSAGGAGALPGGAQPDYLAWAVERAQAAAAPRLLITHGVSGSGKSTLALELLGRAGAIRLRSDVERKRLFGLEALQRSAQQALDIYTPDATGRTFERLAACAREVLRAGYPVIVDAAFLRRRERRAFAALAAELGLPFSILDCRADAQALRLRVAGRAAGGGDASEADLSVLERQLASREPLDEAERGHAIEVDTDAPLDPAALCARWLAAPPPAEKDDGPAVR